MIEAQQNKNRVLNQVKECKSEPFEEPGELVESYNEIKISLPMQKGKEYYEEDLFWDDLEVFVSSSRIINSILVKSIR